MFLTIIVFLAVLGLLVFVHELGHFMTSRLFGVRAEEFGFGFPPRAIGLQRLRGLAAKKIMERRRVDVGITAETKIDSTEVIEEDVVEQREEVDKVVETTEWKLIKGAGEPKYSPAEIQKMKGTIYSLNWIPLGGFVKIKGENGDSRDPDSFILRPVWQRAIILLAGVTMNYVLAIALLSIGLMIGMPRIIDGVHPGALVTGEHIQIIEVLPDTPADQAGVMMGDIITSINGTPFTKYADLQAFVDKNINKTLTYDLKRGNEEIVKLIVPGKRPETGQGGIGVAIAEVGFVSYPWYRAPLEGARSAWQLTAAIVTAFAELFKNLAAGRGAAVDIAGPVGIAALTSQATKLGFIYVLQFAATLSINLALINALPFPALDGGRVLFLIVEKLRGAPVKREVEAIIHNIGFALLMILILLVTFKDVSRYSSAVKTIWEKVMG